MGTGGTEEFFHLTLNVILKMGEDILGIPERKRS